MPVKYIALLIAFAALTAFGCSPTQLGDRELKAEKPLLNSIDEYGEATLKSSGENLNLTIAIPPNNDVCHGTFKLMDSESAYPLLSMLPGFASGPTLFYQGKFDDGLNAKCLALLGKPGGTQMELMVAQPIMFGTDNMIICSSEDRVGKSCAGHSAIYIVQDL